jgi:NAD(P)H-hydrate epimerase
MKEFPVYSGPLPVLDTQQMIEVDRAMIEDFHIELVQMMENAGRNLAHLARVRFLDGAPQRKRVMVLAGSGGNGGGALVCARRLHSWGARVKVVTTKPVAAFRGIPGHQLDILRRMEVGIVQAEALGSQEAFDLVIDGIIGYSLNGAPRGVAARMIRWANGCNAPVLALDVPSGMDTTTGTAYEPSIYATATLTLALPKVGLRGPEIGAHAGELYLADISVPPRLYAEPPLAFEVPHIFAESDIVRLK